MKKVLILYKFLPQYRIEFFNGLKKELEKNNIQLTLVYGKLKNSASKKKDEVELPWAIYRENKTFRVGSTQLIWQPVSDMIKEHDLVITEQANSLLNNYVLMFLRCIGKIKFAFWGHGANLQENPNSFKNRFKYLYLRECDWWFAYTNGVKEFLESKKVNSAHISVVNNAIDTKTLMQKYQNISEEDANTFKRNMNINSEHIGLYCGALYAEKRIDFLIEAGILIRKQIDDFHLIIVGGGEDAFYAEAAAIKYEWIHYVGPKFGIERVIYFKISQLFLLPGAVGLAILDAFAMETPMITVESGGHGPEIEYLKDGVNGVITANVLTSYVDSVVKYFSTPGEIEKMVSECKKSADFYTIEAMIHNFSEGVKKCLH